MECPCGGDPAVPEHGLSQRHFDYMTRAKMREREFQSAIVTMAHYLRWSVYHTYDSRKSMPGFPDLVLVRNRVLFREIKIEKGRLTREQEEWISRLQEAGADAGVWRPRDWDTIEKELTR